ncbi:hypothetical protein [Comamonas sp.]|nr:hypothetical protein [Comamonas sp.]
MQTFTPTKLGIDLGNFQTAMLRRTRTHVARLLPLQGKLAHTR